MFLTREGHPPFTASRRGGNRYEYNFHVFWAKPVEFWYKVVQRSAFMSNDIELDRW